MKRIFLTCWAALLVMPLVIGCGGGSAAPPTAEEVQKNNAAMDASMEDAQKMMQDANPTKTN